MFVSLCYKLFHSIGNVMGCSGKHGNHYLPLLANFDFLHSHVTREGKSLPVSVLISLGFNLGAQQGFLSWQLCLLDEEGHHGQSI